LRGRIWLIGGAVVGIAIAAGRLPYLAGAGRSLADTAQRLVDSGANRLVRDVASSGGPRRLVIGLGGLLAVLAPGVASLLLVVAARGSLRLRAVIGLLIVAVGASSYLYQGHGKATGVLLLALVIAGLAVSLTGPLVAAPLTAIAALIAGEFLPALVSKHRGVTQASVNATHIAIFNHPGTPAPLQFLLLIVAALPFAFAARLILRR
jgi:hypothetical protein